MSSIETERTSSLDSLETLNKKTKKMKKKKKRAIIDNIEGKETAYKNHKIKRIIDFDEEQSNSIKSLAVEVKSTVAVTTRFMKGKMFMFAKASLQNFNYDMIDVFMFPEEDGGAIVVYEKHEVKRCELYQNLTDTDSTSLSFIFICDRSSQISQKESRHITFEVMIVSKVINRLDLSDDFWAQFGVQDKTLKKKVGLYEVESTDNPNIITISVNPKEYFEKHRDKRINKKHK